LTWRLSADALREVLAVNVQRALAVEGPYVGLTRTTLAPQIVTGPIGVQTSRGPFDRAELEMPYERGHSVRIGYRIGIAPAAIELVIYDVGGKRVRQLDRGIRGAGEHLFDWDRCDESGRQVVRGVYLVHLQAGAVRRTRKLVLTRD
jgi:hypothetical protein